MGIYRCPSSNHSDPRLSAPHGGLGKRLSRLTVTSGSSGSSSAIPAPARARLSRKVEAPKRKRSGMDANKKRQIQMAKKKNKYRSQLRRRDASFVFVGNVDPTVSERDLWRTFEKCGPVLRVQKRCSQGLPISVDRRSSLRANIAPSDRQYATVEFKHTPSVARALELNGMPLRGIQIVVCQSADDLPEGERRTHSRSGSQSQAPSTPSPSPLSRFPFFAFLQRKHRTIPRRPTELGLKHGDGGARRPALGGNRPAQKNIIAGISFPKTVM